MQDNAKQVAWGESKKVTGGWGSDILAKKQNDFETQPEFLFSRLIHSVDSPVFSKRMSLETEHSSNSI